MPSESAELPLPIISKILSERGAGLLDNASVGILLVDESYSLQAANRAAKKLLGLPPETEVGKPAIEMFPEHTHEWAARFIGDCFRSERGLGPRILQAAPDDEDPLFMEFSASVSPLAANTRMALVTFRNVTERELNKRVRIHHNQVLEALAEGYPFETLLTRLVDTIETTRPQMLTALFLRRESDGGLQLHSAPRLPDALQKAVTHLEIDPNGPTPSLAAATGHRETTPDIDVDPAWEPFRKIAADAGIRSAWAEPVLDASGKVLAVLGLFYRSPREPDSEDLQVVQTTAHLIGIALARRFAEASLQNARATLEARVRERTEALRAANESLQQEIARHRQTEQELLQERALLTNLMETIPDKIYFKDLQSCFIRISRAHANQFGLENPDEAIGKTDFDFHSEANARHFFADEQKIIRTGKPIIGQEERIMLKDGSIGWSSSTKVPLRNERGEIIGTFGISRDITRSKSAEEALSEERNLLRTLIDILPTRIFVKDRDSHYLINNIAHLKQLGIATQDEALGKTTRDFFPSQRGDQALADDSEVMELGHSIVDREKSDFAEDENDARWSLTTKVPLRDSHNRIVGLVGMSHDITARKQAEKALRERNEEMQADLRMAFEIQQSFLPSQYPVFPAGAQPDETAIAFCHRYLPASTLAGDFFDIFAISDQEAGILISDVMGHGVRASLVTAYLRGLMEEIQPLAHNPGNYLTELNRGLTSILRQAGSPLFVTAFYCVVDIGRGQVRYANAGHPSPILMRRVEDEVIRLRPEKYDPEPALGLMDNFTYSFAVDTFKEHDALLLFTDGLFEIDREDGEQFGEPRLESVIRENIKSPTDRLLSLLIDHIKTFASKEEFGDDVCIVGVDAVNLPVARQPMLFKV